MSGTDPWITWVLRLYPSGFRRRLAEDVADTVEDVLAATPVDERPRVRRRLLLQLARSGITDRLASWLPELGPSHGSRSPFMDPLMHDLRSAYRSLIRRPAFALMVILTLGIGLGTSAAMFGVVHGVLLKPLPYAEPERLISLYRFFTHQDRIGGNMSILDLRDVQEDVGGLAAVAGFNSGQRTLIWDGEPELLSLARATNGLLEVFALEPWMGRDLSAEDAAPGAPATVVLSHELWQKRLGGDTDILGKVLQISGQPHTVVGVAPPGFSFPEGAQGWVSWYIDPEGCGRGCHIMDTVGRLAPETSLEAANRELLALSEGLAEKYPDSNGFKRLAARGLLEESIEPVESSLWLLLGAVQLVVLIAAANVANLVLVRGARRRRELAIRTAVGAGRGRLLRQLMLENGLLALAGSALGILVGQGALKALLRLAPPDLPRLGEVGIDATVFAFTGGLSVLVLILFGWLPAVRMAQADLRSRGATGGPRGKRSRLALLTAEVALALVLLLGAGLLLRSFAQVTRVDLGYEPDRISRFTVSLSGARYEATEAVTAFSDELQRELESIPGVESAGLALAGPFGENQITSFIEPLDRPEPEPGAGLRATFDVVSPRYFETLGVKTLQGRTFQTSDDRRATPVIVISETLAERYFPGEDPIGKRATLGVGFDASSEEDVIYTIVGVVADMRAYSLTRTPVPAVYMAQAQSGVSDFSAFILSRPGLDLMPPVRERLRSLDPTLALRSFGTQEAAIAEAYGPRRFYLALLGAFAAIALVLSAIGLYGVVAYLVSQRTRELAVRMALGADTRRISSLVLGDALRPALAGVALGLIISAMAAQAIEGLLYGISAHDAVTYLAAPLVLIAVATLASLAPTLRAARLEPRVALEDE